MILCNAKFVSEVRDGMELVKWLEDEGKCRLESSLCTACGLQGSYVINTWK